MNNGNFELLDILTIISFALQVQNQSKLFDITDIQEDNNRVSEDIHRHLKQQDEKINRILSILEEKK